MKSYPTYDDIEKCEDEPIGFLPKIQRFGCILILDNSMVVKQVSSNVEELTGVKTQELLETKMEAILSKESFNKLETWYSDSAELPYFFMTFVGKELLVVPKKIQEGILLDIEARDDSWNSEVFRHKLLNSFKIFSNTRTLQELTDQAVIQIKKLSGFDRVMVYRFDDDWNGEIMSEAREANLESWLGLRYPATDIPANARKIFQDQGVRSLANVGEEYADLVPLLHPDSKQLTDISQSFLRGSSPYHIEYLTNMGVEATLSCSIVQNGKLWGLIASHHYTPKTTNFFERESCQLLAEMFSSQIALKISNQTFENIEKTSAIRKELIHNINTTSDILDGLTKYQETGKNLLECSDFVLGFEDNIRSISESLTEAQIKRLTLELFREFPGQDVIQTDCIADICPWLEPQATEVSGVILFKLSQRSPGDFMLWIRPEKLKEVTWGGDVNSHRLAQEQNLRLTPRKSFDKWVEQVQRTSAPWTASEISVLKSFVEDVKAIIVTRFTEVSQLNKHLTNLNEELESFSYSVSHDLRGPLRGIDGFAQVLMEDYGEILDDFGKKSLQTIVQSCAKMNELMDDILGYSGMAKLDRIDDNQDVNQICTNIIRDNNIAKEYPNTEIEIMENIPDIYGDRSMLYQLFLNLITNAVKYSSKSESPKVTIGYSMQGKVPVYFIADNGIGFKPDYAKKIFGVFTRLVHDEYKGTGVGLAIAQRVILKHNGKIWANGELGKGAVFKFSFDSQEIE